MAEAYKPSGYASIQGPSSMMSGTIIFAAELNSLASQLSASQASGERWRKALNMIDGYTTSRIGDPPHDRQKRLNNYELGCDGINHFDHLDEIQDIARAALARAKQEPTQ